MICVAPCDAAFPIANLEATIESSRLSAVRAGRHRTAASRPGGIGAALIAVLALALVLADGSPLMAQMDWRDPPRWEVWCTAELIDIALYEDREAAKEALLDGLIRADTLLSEKRRAGKEFLRNWVDKEFDGVVSRLERRCLEEQGRENVADILFRGSEWLESTGIGGPAVSPWSPDALEDLIPYLSNRSPNCEAFYCAVVAIGPHSWRGWYRGSQMILFLGPGVVDDAWGGPQRAPRGERFVAVHEMFHAVQRGYDTLPFSDTHDWITEGTAEHVERTAAAKWGGSPGAGWTKRYDSSLHLLPCDLQDDDCPPGWWSYGSWSFWDFAGEALGSPEGIAYLDEVLQADLGPDKGITGVEQAIRSAGWSEGLYDLFPEFVKERLVETRWFEDPREASIALPDGEDEAEETITGTLEPVAAEFVELTTEVRGNETARLTIRAERQPPRPEDLHLVVDDRRVDRNGAGVLEYLVDVPSGERRHKVRVVNVAREPADTEDLPYELTIRLDRVDPCDPEVMIAAVEDGFTAGQMPDMLEAHGAPGMSRESVQSALREGMPVSGRANLSIGGLVNDAGSACAQPLGRRHMGGRPDRAAEGDRDEQLGNLQRSAEDAQARMERASQEVFGKSLSEMTQEELENATPEQQAEWMRLAGISPGRTAERTWRDREGDVLIRVHSPNAQLALTGVAAPFDAVHGGLGQWRPNAAAHVGVRLEGTAAADLREGGSYRAVPLEQRVGAPQIVYTRWEGDRVSCQGPRPGVDECFVGTTRTVTAEPSGRVTIEEITGTQIKGRLDVSGPARIEVKTFRLDREGRHRVEESEARGDITLSGRFEAPVERRYAD